MTPTPATSHCRVRSGTHEAGFDDDFWYCSIKGRAKGARVDGDPLKCGREPVLAKEFVDERPHLLQALLHALMGVLGAEAQPKHPLHAVVQVVVDLLDRLRGNGGNRRIQRRRQRPVQPGKIRRGEELAGDGRREVAVRLLEQLVRAELVLVAEIREIILRLVPRRSRIGQETARVAEEVEADVAECDVLFEFGCVRDPLPQPVRENERVIAEPDHILRHGLRRNDR
jgi:hypothetical protein